MAEVAVAVALGSLQIIIPLLTQLHLHKDDEEGIRSMESWLSSLKAFIEDTSYRRDLDLDLDRQQQQQQQQQQDLMNKAAKIIFEIENVLDEFLLHAPPYTFHHYSFTREIHRRAHQLRHRLPLPRLSKKVKSIRKSIDDITSQIAFLNFRVSESPSSSSSVVMRVSPLLLDHEMVDYEIARNEFIRRLEAEEKRLVKLAVDGPGGSGKTTLVKNVFWKPRIQAQFDCHAWVCVSNQKRSDVEKICQNLLKQLCSSRREPYPPDDGLPLQTRLRNYLGGKRYLVVLDDVWREQDWRYLNDALPDSFCRSRVIVTTRCSDVSAICDHKTSLLGLESLDAWKLFCSNAFPGINGECPLELKDTSIKIVKRCEGLPLAILAVVDKLQKKPQLPMSGKDFTITSGMKYSKEILSNTMLCSAAT